MTRPILLALSALVLAACGDAGVTVHGSVSVTSPDATERRFDFSTETRLDGAGPGRFTGGCHLVRTLDAEGNEQWGALMDIRSGGAAGDESPFTSLSVMQNTGAAPHGGRIEIELGGVSYTPVDGGCALDIPYALRDGVVGFAGRCELANAADERVTVALELDLAGCTVDR